MVKIETWQTISKTLIIIVVFLFLVTAFMPVFISSSEDISGGNACEAENCYYNYSVTTCYNTSDQFEECPATPQSFPLQSLYNPLGVVLLLGAVLVLSVLIKQFKIKGMK